MKKQLTILQSLLLAFTLEIISADQTYACGGFFCNGLQPVNQNAERIVFARKEGKIHMHVQIKYEGPPTNFGWMIPVPEDVETMISSEALFAALDRLYGPYFNLNYEYGENCAPPPYADADCPNCDLNTTQPEPNDPSIQILSRENIGPYDRAIIKTTDVQLLRNWLNENQFSIPPNVDSKLQPYIDLNAVFIVIKLRPGQDVGDIVPLSLTFSGDRPSIPLKPTAVAATNDMGVIVHLLDHHRAVPVNYQHVQINEKAIDWLSNGNNYASVVSQAIDEAGGKAFVTDYAGTVGDQLPDLIRPYSEAELSEIENVSNTRDLFLLNIDRTNPDYQRILLSMVMPPDGVSYEDYAACPNCYGLEDQPLDGILLAEKMRTEINPVYTELHHLLTTLPYLTRLYATLSPSEMVDDPLFSFNMDLENVSNQHTATAKITCDESGNATETKITLSNGQTYLTEDVQPTLRQDGETVRGDMPAANVIEQMMEAGQPELIFQNMDISIDPTDPTDPTDPIDPIDPTNGNTTDVDMPIPKSPDIWADDDGCQQTPNSLFLSLLLSFFTIIFYRKSRHSGSY